MALHEVERYAEVLPSGLQGMEMRFLQNSSAYWGAALYGQLDVAFATAGAAVICKASLPSEIAEAVRRHRATAFGAAPSVLAHLAPEDVPSVRCVISWAEGLPDAIAARWCGRVVLRDLLIATEYWLSFFAPLEQGRALSIVSGVHVVILAPDGSEPVRGSDMGELCLAGATVCPGYADPANDEGRFLDFDGRRYFRTRDLARWLEPGRRLEYCGRCDDLAKIGGKWADTAALEAAVLAVPGVREAKLIFEAQQRHAFLILDPCNGKLAEKLRGMDETPGLAASPLAAVRRALPAGCAVHVVAGQELPRHAATGKVDRRVLLQSVREEDLVSVLLERRERVLSRYARTYRCVAYFCHKDPRRMLCLAYIWYGFLFCTDFHRYKAIISKCFPYQGGIRAVMLGMAWALPLDQLQRIAAPGATRAKTAGRGLEWVMVFLAALPYWLRDPEPNKRGRSGEWTREVGQAAEHCTAELQTFSAKWAGRACASCGGAHAVTLFPALDACCGACKASAGAQHEPRCLRKPTYGARRCDNCSFEATFHPRFCCYTCQASPGEHGLYCARTPHVPTLPEEAGAGGVEGKVQAEREETKAAGAEAEAWAEREEGARDPGQHCQEEEEEEAPPPALDERAVLGLLARLPCGPSDLELGPLDSLRSLRLISAVRQELGRSLALRDLASCRTVADLVAQLRQAPECRRQRFRDPGGAGFRLWTFGWSTCLQWLLRSERALEPSAVRAALARLVGRHAALRLRRGEQPEVQAHFMEAAATLDLLRTGARSSRALPTASKVLEAAQAALQTCWPRWRTPALPESELDRRVFVQLECAAAEVESWVKKLRKDFSPPFQLALLRHPLDADKGGCHLCVLISHAIADGSALVPLLQDLAQLCAEEQERAECGPEPAMPPAKRRLPQPPHFGAILEDRLLRTLAGQPAQDDAMYLDRRMDFFAGHFPEAQCRGYHQSFNVVPEETRELRQLAAALVPGCPMELALLSMVVLSLARTEAASSVRIVLVHHGRDQPPGAADVVGLFTDFRVLAVPTSELVSLMGVLSFVSSAVQERKWRPPGVLEPIDTLVNIVPSPFGRVGWLSQAPRLAWTSGAWSDWPAEAQEGLWQSTRMKPLKRKFELQVEQVDADEWNLAMYLDEAAYPPEKGRRLRSCWLEVLRGLREDPLQSVLRSEHRPKAKAKQDHAEVPRSGGGGGLGAAGAASGRGGGCR